MDGASGDFLADSPLKDDFEHPKKAEKTKISEQKRIVDVLIMVQSPSWCLIGSLFCSLLRFA